MGTRNRGKLLVVGLLVWVVGAVALTVMLSRGGRVRIHLRNESPVVASAFLLSPETPGEPVRGPRQPDESASFSFIGLSPGEYVAVVRPAIIERDRSVTARLEPAGPEKRTTSDDPVAPTPLTDPYGTQCVKVTVRRWAPTDVSVTLPGRDASARLRVVFLTDQWPEGSIGLASSGWVTCTREEGKHQFRVRIRRHGVDLPAEPYHYGRRFLEYLLAPGEYRVRTEPGNERTLMLGPGACRVHVVDGKVQTAGRERAAD